MTRQARRAGDGQCNISCGPWRLGEWPVRAWMCCWCTWEVLGSVRRELLLDKGLLGVRLMGGLMHVLLWLSRNLDVQLSLARDLLGVLRVLLGVFWCSSWWRWWELLGLLLSSKGEPWEAWLWSLDKEMYTGSGGRALLRTWLRVRTMISKNNSKKERKIEDTNTVR
ncbi:hypothetical protein V6N13_104989 [Hibiscus sabdariffa]|uniref:Uncharacterized protein n=2 Tax=Hibiscus sabdariffa TaxID=183260 RepID=A0ABR2AM11_9ROSI